MKTNNNMNKRAISVPILIWAVVAFILILVSLNNFLLKDSGKSESLKVPYFIDKVYVNEKILDYHLEKVFEKVAGESPEGEFVDRFLEEMENYKNAKGEYAVNGFDEVEKGISEESVEFVDAEKKLVLNIDVKVKEVSNGIAVSYNYKKKFEKEFE